MQKSPFSSISEEPEDDTDSVAPLPTFRAGVKRRDSVAVMSRRRPSVTPPSPPVRRGSVTWQKAQTLTLGLARKPPETRSRRRSVFLSKGQGQGDITPRGTLSGSGITKPGRKDEVQRRLSVAQDSLKEIAGEFEKTKDENEEIRKQNRRLQERSASTMNQMERTQRLLDRIRNESTRKSTEMDKLLQEFSTLGDRIRALENKAMEVEKLEISVETLKKSLDNTQQEVREREREVRQLQRTLEDTEKKLTISEAKVDSLEKSNHDLKLQVRKELMRTTELEMKIENTDRVKNAMVDKEREIETLKREVDEKNLIAQHARKCLREERSKCKELEDNNHDMASMKEEVEITKSETQTLKRLLAAKDVVIHQRSQTNDNLKNILKDHVTSHVYHEILQNLEKLRQSDSINHQKQGQPSITSPRHTDHKRSKSQEHLRGGASRPNRSHTNGTVLFKQILNDDHDGHSTNNGDSSPRPLTTIVRPRVYNDSFSDFRSDSPSCSDVTSMNSVSTYNSSDSSRLRRAHSLRVSGSRSSMGTSSSVELVNGWGNQNGGDHKPVMTQSDTKLKQHVKPGDRVVVDINKKKGGDKDYHTAIVKYVGYLDGERDTYRVFVGIKLDGPDGDSDGAHRSTRYFRVSPCHGKFVRIQKIAAVFDKQTGAYCTMADLISQPRDQSSRMSLQSRQ